MSRYHALLLVLFTACSITCAETGNATSDARRELFAARYENAARLFSQIVAAQPETETPGMAWYERSSVCIIRAMFTLPPHRLSKKPRSRPEPRRPTAWPLFAAAIFSRRNPRFALR